MLDQFFKLTPDMALKAVESQGHLLTGRFLQLNSYENRVFSMECESQNKAVHTEEDFYEIIAKFYRPQRWSKAAIQEEHNFLFELESEGLKVISPLNFSQQSLFEMEGILFCSFPKGLGRLPQELTEKELKQVGRSLAHLHNVGSRKKALNRPTLTTEYFGDESLNLTLPLLPEHLKKRYQEAAADILDLLDDRLNPDSYIRIHGDCHKGNLLQTDPKDGNKEFFFVDFDDFINGPAVYDFWMLASTPEELENMISGYQELRNFDRSSLEIIPALRGLRMIYYSAWIAKRWKDPSFKKIFPEFNSFNYWAQETEDLEKIAWSL